MNKSIIKTYSDLQATHLRVYFIYTFLFTRIDVEKLHFKTKSKQKLLDLMNETDDKYEEAYIHWAGGEPIINGEAETEEKISYLDPFLHLKAPHIHLKTRAEKVHLKYDGKANKIFEQEINKTKVRFNCQIIIFDSGWGRFMFIMDVFRDPEKPLSKEAVIEISNLGLRKQPLSSHDKSNDELCNVKVMNRHGNERYLFEMFWETMCTMKKDINRIMPFQKISWIEVEENLVGRPISMSNKTGEPLTHFQNPFPIIILQVPQEQYAMNFLDEEESAYLLGSKTRALLFTDKERTRLRAKYTKELLSVLFRSKESKFPDFTFAKKFVGIIDGALVNMCSTCSIFFHLYSRSCLVISPNLGIHENGDISEMPGSYLIPCLVSTVSLLRCRWHAYATFSKLLDKLIGSLRDEDVDSGKDLDQIIQIRGGAARSLVDSISYRAGSGSLNKLYEVGISLFRIEELQRIIVEKFSILDRLYSNLYEKKRIQELKEMEEEMRE